MRRPTRLLLLFFTLAFAGLPAVAHAGAGDLPPGTDWYKGVADWSQVTIPSTDGVMLHGDLLRPKGLPADAKTPVIVSIGPYFNHSGQEGPVGAAEGTSYDPTADVGPSNRFEDFVIESHLMQKGYSFLMVDLRGFGGSTGCLDWSGPGEQADVKAADEFAASMKGSTGQVGMYGKSYDGLTGLIGESQQPKGLDAIVSQEPVYDDYNYLYTNGVRFENSVATPALYDGISLTPGNLQDDPTYNINSQDPTNTGACQIQNYANQATNNDHTSDFWKARNLIAESKGHAIPLLLTQGFIENNTKPDGAWDYFNELTGPKRGWFDMSDHIRGNDLDETAGADAVPDKWFGEVMRWYDYYVKGDNLADAPVDKDPQVEVETNDGSWRAEASFPAPDATALTTDLKPGTYTDTGQNDGSMENSGTPDTTGVGIWTISPPLTSAAHFSGVPKATFDVSTLVPNANLSVDLYDINPKNSAMLLSRTAYLLPASGKYSADMYGDDWNIPAGDRIGVLVSTANGEWWTPVGTQTTVTLNSGQISIPFLKYNRTATIPGKLPTRLAAWTSAAPFTIDAATVTSGTSNSFAVPPAMTDAPAGSPVTQTGTNVYTGTGGDNGTAPAGVSLGGTTGTSVARPRIIVRVLSHRAKGSRVRKITVYGTAPAGSKLVVHLRRGARTVLSHRVTTKYGSFRVTFRVRRAGKYRGVVSAVLGKQKLKGASTLAKVK